MIVPAIGRNGTGIARPVRYGLPDMELCGAVSYCGSRFSACGYCPNENFCYL